MNNKREQIKLEGSAQDVAGQIFEAVITPVYSRLHSVHETEADNFAFCMAGCTIAGYLAASNDLEADKTRLLMCIEEICKDIQNEKKGLGILAKPMGKPA